MLTQYCVDLLILEHRIANSHRQEFGGFCPVHFFVARPLLWQSDLGGYLCLSAGEMSRVTSHQLFLKTPSVSRSQPCFLYLTMIRSWLFCLALARTIYTLTQWVSEQSVISQNWGLHNFSSTILLLYTSDSWKLTSISLFYYYSVSVLFSPASSLYHQATADYTAHC